MKLTVLARLNPPSPGPVGGSAVLIEGDWPEGTGATDRWSLDTHIDSRFEWIDEAASYWTEVIAHEPCAGDAPSPVQPAWLNALALRYYLVKLIRVVAFFSEVRRLNFGDEVEFNATRGRDEDYADIIGQLCRLAGSRLGICWNGQATAPAPVSPANHAWRRALARAAEWIDPRVSDVSAPRIVFCGNPRLLEPVCRETTHRGGQAWWLCDRLAMRSWLRWRRAGCGQLVCNSSLGVYDRLPRPDVGPIDCRDVDLSAAVARWLTSRMAALGRQQTRIVEQVERHFLRIRPDALVLDEDQTPFHRAAVAAARRHGVRSFVVQHGAPCCRFGFAPLEADEFLAWGLSTRNQLARWAVPTERITTVGSLHPGGVIHGQRARKADDRPARIVLLTTVPPRDERPDAVVFHFNRTTYREMVDTAAAAVSRLPAAELLVKMHPRAAGDPVVESAVARNPRLHVRWVRTGSLDDCLAEADCVLSCLSSAGIEATLAGLPVIQLAPVGSGRVLPHEEWGLLGTARTETELDRLLAQALSSDWRPAAVPNPDVFFHETADATSTAARIAEIVLRTAHGTRQTRALEPRIENELRPAMRPAHGAVRAAG